MKADPAAPLSLPPHPLSFNLHTFFEKFELFADAPDAVAKMREFVLELAAQGRLVSQSPNDEPADALAITITEDRAAFAKKKSLARQRIVAPVEDDQCPFSLPPGWIWTRLGNLCRVQPGFAFQSSAFVQGDSGVPMIRIRDITKDHTQVNYVGEYREEFLVDAGDYLVGMDGNFTVAKWRGPRALLNQRVSRLQWYSRHLEPSFFAIAAQYRLSELQGTKAYTTVDHLSSGQIENAVVPLPPLAEQKRIVAKVDELMALCDRLEAQQQERETRHAALARAALARFADAPTPANLNFLFHSSFSIQPSDLRKSILTLAVQGKLVPQDPNEEPVEDALRRCGVDMKRWGVAEEEQRQDVPSSWTWIRFAGVGKQRLGKMLDAQKNRGESKPYLRNTNVQWMRFELDDVKKMRVEEREEEELRLKHGDLLICEGGEPGRCSIWRDEVPEMYFQKALHRVRPYDAILSEFLALNLQIDCRNEVLAGYFTGATIKHLTGRSLSEYPIPIPPLAEQRRIVAKVDQLMSLVDALETQLAASRATAGKLLEALVCELTAA